MENVFFKPYVGKNYFEGYLGKKLLILGESHYCDGNKCNETEICLQLPDCNSFTKDRLSEFFDYKKGILEAESWMRTFTRFTNVFLGEKVGDEDLLRFWDRVMFYNYVQYPTQGPRKSPTKQDFENSETAFFEILEEYRPDLIIIWGARLEKELPLKNKTISNFEILNESGHKFHYYDISGKKIPAYAIYHPSLPMFLDSHHDFLKEALRLADFDIQ